MQLSLKKDPIVRHASRALVVVLLLLSLVAPAHAAFDAAIFPPTAVFVLPPEIVGGPVTVLPLSRAAFGGPARPVSRTEYDVKGGTLSYRVLMFGTVADAAASFGWQMANVRSNDSVFQEQHLPKGERVYTVAGFTVAALIYRNIEIVTSQPTKRKKAREAVRALNQLLLAAAVSSTAQNDATSPQAVSGTGAVIFPPVATFALQDGTSGLTAQVAGGGYSDNLAGLGAGYALRFSFSFGSTHIPGASERGGYEVDMFQSADIAARALTLYGAISPEDARLGVAVLPLPPESSPLAWLIGNPIAPHCFIRGGTAFRNLTILTDYHAEYRSEAMAYGCRQEILDVVGIEQQLVQQIQSYAQHAPPQAAAPTAQIMVTAVPGAPTPTDTPTPSLDLDTANAAIWSAEAVAGDQLSLFEQLQQTVMSGLISRAEFLYVAKGAARGVTGEVGRLQSTPLLDRYVSVRAYLYTALAALSSLWRTVGDAGGDAASPAFAQYYQEAATNLTLAEQLVPLSS